MVCSSGKLIEHSEDDKLMMKWRKNIKAIIDLTKKKTFGRTL